MISDKKHPPLFLLILIFSFLYSCARITHRDPSSISYKDIVEKVNDLSIDIIKSEEKLINLYNVSYELISPALVSFADFILQKASKENNPKIIFIARDGIGSYIASKVLIEKFPARYKIKDTDVQYLFLNKSTMRSDLIEEYVLNLNIKENDSVFLVDLGWHGSLARKFKRLFEKINTNYHGLHLLISKSGLSNKIYKIYGFLYDSYQEESEIFDKIGGNKRVHFLEDTFSGFERRRNSLKKVGDNKIVAISILNEPPYEGENLMMRLVALKGIYDNANNLNEKKLNELNKAEIKEKLFNFLSEKENFINIMVPHEKH